MQAQTRRVHVDHVLEYRIDNETNDKSLAPRGKGNFFPILISTGSGRLNVGTVSTIRI